MLGILCGLSTEATIARTLPSVQVACAAARPQTARWLGRELVRQGVTRLLSFGIAGGLEPGLPPGSVIIGTEVKSKDATWACDGKWLMELTQKLPMAHCGPVWGSEFIIPSAKDKRALYEKSRCLIADLESHCVAQVAAEAGLPFAVVRVVGDAAEHAVPPAARLPLKENGKPDIRAVLWNLLRHPRQLPDLIRIARSTGTALDALRRTAKILA